MDGRSSRDPSSSSRKGTAVDVALVVGRCGGQRIGPPMEPTGNGDRDAELQSWLVVKAPAQSGLITSVAALRHPLPCLRLRRVPRPASACVAIGGGVEPAAGRAQQSRDHRTGQGRSRQQRLSDLAGPRRRQRRHHPRHAARPPAPTDGVANSSAGRPHVVSARSGSLAAPSALTRRIRRIASRTCVPRRLILLEDAQAAVPVERTDRDDCREDDRPE